MVSGEFISFVNSFDLECLTKPLKLICLFYRVLLLSSKLVFYAQSTGTVISGRYTSHIEYLIFNNMYVLKWAYIQF